MLDNYNKETHFALSRQGKDLHFLPTDFSSEQVSLDLLTQKRNQENAPMPRTLHPTMDYVSFLTKHFRLNSIAYLFLSFLFFFTQLQAEQYLILSLLGNNAIESWKINEVDGSIEYVHRLSSIEKLGFSTMAYAHPYLYISGTAKKGSKSQPAIYTVKVLKNGKLKLRGVGKINYSPGYLAVDHAKEMLFISHFFHGRATSHFIEKGIYRGKTAQDLITDNNPHSVGISRDGRYLYIPHTKPNKIYQFYFDAHTKSLSPLSPPFVSGPKVRDPLKDPSDPRHLVFHPKLPVMYVSDEKIGSLSSWKIQNNGSLNLWQTMKTRNNDFTREKQSTSGLCISPNGQYVFVINRDGLPGNKSPDGKDTITSFAIDPSNGKISHRIGAYPTGRTQRSIKIDHHGEYLYTADHKQSKLHVYKVSQEDGTLERTKIIDFKEKKKPLHMCVVHFD